MKSLLTAVLLLATIATSLLASPGSHTVTTNAQTVLPARPILAAPAWSTNTTAVIGDVYKTQDGTYYMALAAGALPAAPTASYQRLFPRDRAFATVQNTGATDIWVAFGAAAVSGAGLKLVPGAVVSVRDYQGLVSTVSSAAGGTVATTEVPK